MRQFLRTLPQNWRRMSPVPFPVAALACLLAVVAAVAMIANPPDREKPPMASATTRVEESAGSLPMPTGAQSYTPEWNKVKQQVELGRKFFDRCLTIDALLGSAYDDVRAWFRAKQLDGDVDPTWKPPPRVATAKEWRQLAEWWNSEGRILYLPFLETWLEEEQRFKQLVKECEGGDFARERELRELIYKVGAEWLCVPYNDNTQTFDLNAPLPARAPERHLAMIRALRGVQERIDQANRIPRK